METLQVGAQAAGCLALIAAVLVGGFVATRAACSETDVVGVRPATTTADLTRPGPFTLKADHVVCLSREALAQSDAYIGDVQALARFLLDASNGCTITKAGVRVYTERVAYHVQRIHPVGSPTLAFVHDDALAP